MNKYRFDKKRHLHQLFVDGKYKNLTGCTTILSVISKPYLIPWAAKMTIEHIRKKAPVIDIDEGMETKYVVSEKLLEEAKNAHCAKRDKAGDWGTKIHGIIESYIISQMNNTAPNPEIENEKQQKSLNDFINWEKSNKVKFLETEKNVYSEKLFIGGIVDFICEIDGQIWIGDIKTSKSGIQPDNFWQCAGYNLMLEDMGLYKKVVGYLILNLKENGEFNEKRSISNDEHRDAFTSCLKIYRIKEKINNIIK